MNFIDELKWRDMLHDMTPGTEEKLANGGIKGYIGFDPTAPSLTIGNYVQLMILRMFQKAGNTPIILMGGATGRIGDPSGKDAERQLKTYDELDHNLHHQLEQMKKFLSFEGDNAAIIVNNLDFYKDMNVLDFLRDVGKTITVSYMMSKDSVQKRLETGLSFTEFSYQLLQGYDFQLLYEKENCELQMGGSDQWGNITSGTEFIRRNLGGKAYAVTTPLLTKSDGSKFGKSAEGNIWLDATLTSPYKFYQFWVNADDADIPKYMRYFMDIPQEELLAIEAEHGENPQMLKRILAEYVTTAVHSKEDFEAAMEVSNMLFNKKASQESLFAMSTDSLNTVAEEIPSFKISKEEVVDQAIVDVLSDKTDIFSSKSDCRRAIKGNAISINREKISSADHCFKGADLIKEKYIMIDNGKKNKYMLVVD